MRPGYKTTEFWITLAGQIVSLCVILGFVNPSDKQHLQDTVSAAVASVFALVTSFFTIVHYVSSRTALKHRALDQASDSGGTPPPAEETGPASLPPFTPVAILLALCLLPGLAAAQQVERQPTCLFGWRQRQADPQMLMLLQQISMQQQQIIALLQQHQQAPVQPHIIVLGGPYQQIPLGGPPRQEIPLGGPPRQDIPLGGPPRQEIPLGGPPRQEIPLGPAPRQDIPLGPTQPRQQIPLGETKPAAPDQRPMPTVPMSYQRYTRSR